MPYPNSQTPVTMRLNEIFADRATHMPNGLRDLTDQSKSVAQLAIDYQVVQGATGRKHINQWPKSQQNLVRDALIYAFQHNIPISFDWQNDSTTVAEIVYFEDRIGVTLRSPLNYPPYWGQ